MADELTACGGYYGVPLTDDNLGIGPQPDDNYIEARLVGPLSGSTSPTRMPLNDGTVLRLYPDGRATREPPPYGLGSPFRVYLLVFHHGGKPCRRYEFGRISDA